MKYSIYDLRGLLLGTVTFSDAATFWGEVFVLTKQYKSDFDKIEDVYLSSGHILSAA